jgi:hypothetical protein
MEDIMSLNGKYFSVIRAQWQHIGFSDVHKIRTEQANENAKAEQKSAKEKVSADRELVDQE